MLWFVLALGGIFVVSALVGLLTSGLHRQLEQLRKGRSPVIETGHTVILGWSDQVYTVVSELVEANRSRKRAAIAILAEQDKVYDGGPAAPPARRHRQDPADLPHRQPARPDRPRDGQPQRVPGRSSCSPRPRRAPRTRTPTCSRRCSRSTRARPSATSPTTWSRRCATSRNRAVARLAGGDAVVIDGDDISARLIVQTARQSRLSVVYHDLLDFGGDEFYLIAEPRLVGQHVRRRPRWRTAGPARSASSTPTARRSSTRRWRPSSGRTTSS